MYGHIFWGVSGCGKTISDNIKLATNKKSNGIQRKLKKQTRSVGKLKKLWQRTKLTIHQLLYKEKCCEVCYSG